ncbi:energy transducer TonB [uncultured Prevotella sp.]|uniref:energy transducer TonB n=1 Tax=uncultured Prevotella sp. TaxID=159272 RepID=UPI0026074DA1|nr:energy transducer TonB [uncultured Prevotella sp.]
MSKIDLISNAWCDLVFEGKNQAYGAYKLRKGTSKRNLWSIIIVLIAAVAIFSAIAIKNVIEANQKVAIVTEAKLSKIDKTPKVEKKKAAPKIEQPKVVEKVKSSIKFTAPVIKKDSEVKPEEEMKTQEDLQKTKTTIGAFTVVGNDEIGGEVLKAKEEIAQPEPPKNEEENKVFDVVEEQPSFPGGQGALMAWLRDNIKYPVVAAENGIEGKVIVQFVVGKNGSISNVKVVKSIDPSLDREAVRVVSSMPSWTPGKQNGTSVNVRYTLPVTFKLQ